MRTLIICGTAALALGACQRPATDETAMESDAAIDATATTDDGSAAMAEADTASTATGVSRSTGASTSSRSRASAGGDASEDTMGSIPADQGMMSGPSPAVRDGAKEKAEQTNLHPKPN